MNTAKNNPIEPNVTLPNLKLTWNFKCLVISNFFSYYVFKNYNISVGQFGT